MSNSQNAQSANPCKVVISGRTSYMHVHEARGIDGDPNSKKKFSLTILIPKTDTAQLTKIGAAITAAYQRGLEETNAKRTLKGVNPQTMQNPLKDGDLDPKKKEDPAYKGHYFISLKSDTQPVLLDENKNPLLDKTKMYSGCFCHVAANFFPFNNIQKGIGAGLNHVMKYADGEPLAGTESAEQAFAGIAPGTATGAPAAVNLFGGVAF